MGGSAVGACGRGPSVETAFDEKPQPVAQAFGANSGNDIGHKGLHEHDARFVLGYASCLHVEQRLLVELSGCGSVGTFHVVAVYFELRACVHAGIGRCEQVAVGLISFGEHCAFLDAYRAFEGSV